LFWLLGTDGAWGVVGPLLTRIIVATMVQIGIFGGVVAAKKTPTALSGDTKASPPF
jgi:hypothetical protein